MSTVIHKQEFGTTQLNPKLMKVLIEVIDNICINMKDNSALMLTLLLCCHLTSTRISRNGHPCWPYFYAVQNTMHTQCISWKGFCISLCDDFFSISAVFMHGLELLYSFLFLYKEVVFIAPNAEIKHPLIWQPKSLMHLGTKCVNFARNLAPKPFVPTFKLHILWEKYLIWTFDQHPWAVLLKAQAERIKVFFTSKRHEYFYAILLH